MSEAYPLGQLSYVGCILVWNRALTRNATVSLLYVLMIMDSPLPSLPLVIT